jgi:hypothetical protein
MQPAKTAVGAWHLRFGHYAIQEKLFAKACTSQMNKCQAPFPRHIKKPLPLALAW